MIEKNIEYRLTNVDFRSIDKNFAIHHSLIDIQHSFSNKNSLWDKILLCKIIAFYQCVKKDRILTPNFNSVSVPDRYIISSIQYR